MTLKEAIDMTFDKYNTEKNIDSYRKILMFLSNGEFSYITSDKNEENISARMYVISNFHDEFAELYNEAMVGKETVIGETPSIERMVYVIADYFNNQNKMKKSFRSNSNAIDEYLYRFPEEHRRAILNDLVKSDVKNKLTVIENAYRLYIISQSRSGNPVLDLYSNENVDINKRVDLMKVRNNYLNYIFMYVEPNELSAFIKKLTDDEISGLIDYYVVTRQTSNNINMIKVADTLVHNDMAKSIAIFNEFNNPELIKGLTNNGMSY